MNDYENDWDDRYEDDLEAQGQRLVRLLQANSPQLLPGDKHVEGAAVGKFLLPQDGGWLVVDCYAFQAIGAFEAYTHWAPNRGGLLGVSQEKPKNARWLKEGVPKEGLYDPDGSLYERTVYVNELVRGVGRPLQRLNPPICATYAYRVKAFNIGRNFYHAKLKTTVVLIDGKRVRNMVLGLWEKSSEIAHGRNNYAWMAPVMRLLGVVGDVAGPSLEEAEYARTLRAAFKSGEAWEQAAPPAIGAQTQTQAPRIPSAESAKPAAPAKPKIDVRSGSDAWSGPAEPPSPPTPSNDDPGSPHSLDEVIFD